MVAAANLLSCNGHPIPPSPHFWVTDQAGFISPGIGLRLNRELQEYEERTRHQVLVYISERDLAQTPIEDYCAMAFNAWGIGRSGKDDGLVWFIFPKGDKLRMRIQVGYGLEAALTDREAVAVLRSIGPSLESHNLALHDVGVENGVHQILREIEQH